MVDQLAHKFFQLYLLQNLCRFLKSGFLRLDAVEGSEIDQFQIKPFLILDQNNILGLYVRQENIVLVESGAKVHQLKNYEKDFWFTKGDVVLDPVPVVLVQSL